MNLNSPPLGEVPVIRTAKERDGSMGTHQIFPELAKETRRGNQRFSLTGLGRAIGRRMRARNASATPNPCHASDGTGSASGGRSGRDTAAPPPAERRERDRELDDAVAEQRRPAPAAEEQAEERAEPHDDEHGEDEDETSGGGLSSTRYLTDSRSWLR